MRAKWLVSASLLAALATGVAACGDDDEGGGGGGGEGGAAIEGSTLTIYSSLPQQGASGPQAEAMQNGAKLAVEAKGGKVGPYSVKYVPLDDSLASTGAADEGKAAQNARKAVQDKTTAGYIGEYNSGISKVTIPILNKAGIPQISPANTYVGLTTDLPGSEPGEPDKYYPTQKRTYARVVPTDIIQGAALATAAAGGRLQVDPHLELADDLLGGPGSQPGDVREGDRPGGHRQRGHRPEGAELPLDCREDRG